MFPILFHNQKSHVKKHIHAVLDLTGLICYFETILQSYQSIPKTLIMENW